MKEYLGFVAVSVFLLSCADDTRDNPYDERAVNYIGNASAEDSSSSVETNDYPSSSSGDEEPSSSSEDVSSSSEEALSSSSVETGGEPSSSSASVSSSSEEALSSSSVGAGDNSSSSSEAESSSSEESLPSSGSIEPSSSSAELSSSSTVPSGGSSSSIEQGISSSETASSSSEESLPSSSSYEDLCAGFDGTKRVEHYGMGKYQFCDERDGKKYVYVKIGTQTWMAENLNYDASGSECYKYLDSNCETYGKLYDWSTAMDLPPSCNPNPCPSQIQSPHRGICPSGWHIPSQAEWNVITSGTTGGQRLKATSGWDNHYLKSNDSYGFSALPGGYGLSSGSFNGVGSNGYWWSASEASGGYNGYYLNMLYSEDQVIGSTNIKQFQYSVRCVQD